MYTAKRQVLCPVSVARPASLSFFKERALFKGGAISIIWEASLTFSNSKSKFPNARIPWLAYYKLHKEMDVNCFYSLNLEVVQCHF